jgi:transposase
MADTTEARAYSEETADLVRRDHAAGISTRELKSKYQMSIHTVGRILNRTGAYGPKAGGAGGG